MKTAVSTRFLIAALLVAGAVMVTALTSRVNVVSEAGISMDLPERLGEWTGVKIEPSELEVKLLPKDTEFSKRVYTNEANETVYCSIVLSSSDPRSIHRPELCLPTQGVRITDSRVIQVPVRGLPKPLPVMQLSTVAPLIGRNGEALRTAGGDPISVPGYFYYWFVGKDRITAQHYERILWNMWDRTIFNTSHRWAYIIVQGTVTADLPPGYRPSRRVRTAEETRTMLTDFIAEVFPVINRTRSVRS